MSNADTPAALDETAALALRAAFPAGGLVWTPAGGGRSRPGTSWADYRDPVDESDPIRLARLAGEITADQAATEIYAPTSTTAPRWRVSGNASCPRTRASGGARSGCAGMAACAHGSGATARL